jgi:hypothetical protein
VDSTIRYVGLDVDKGTIVIAIAEEGGGEANVLGKIPNDSLGLLKVLSRLGRIDALRRGDIVWDLLRAGVGRWAQAWGTTSAPLSKPGRVPEIEAMQDLLDHVVLCGRGAGTDDLHGLARAGAEGRIFQPDALDEPCPVAPPDPHELAVIAFDDRHGANAGASGP